MNSSSAQTAINSLEASAQFRVQSIPWVTMGVLQNQTATRLLMSPNMTNNLATHPARISPSNDRSLAPPQTLPYPFFAANAQSSSVPVPSARQNPQATPASAHSNQNSTRVSLQLPQSNHPTNMTLAPFEVSNHNLDFNSQHQIALWQYTPQEFEAQYLEQLRMEQLWANPATHPYGYDYNQTIPLSSLSIDNHGHSIRGPYECHGHLSNGPMIDNEWFVRQPNQAPSSMPPQQQQTHIPRSTQNQMPPCSMSNREYCGHGEYSNSFTNQFGNKQSNWHLHGHFNGDQPNRAQFIQGPGYTELHPYQDLQSNQPGLYQTSQNSSSSSSSAINQNLLNSELTNTSQQQMYSTAAAFVHIAPHPLSNVNPYPVGPISPEPSMQGPRSEYGTVRDTYPKQVASTQLGEVVYYTNLTRQLQLSNTIATTSGPVMTSQQNPQNPMLFYSPIVSEPQANASAASDADKQSALSYSQQTVRLTNAVLNGQMHQQQQPNNLRSGQQPQQNSNTGNDFFISPANPVYSSPCSDQIFYKKRKNKQLPFYNSKLANQISNQLMSTGQSGEQLTQFDPEARQLARQVGIDIPNCASTESPTNNASSLTRSTPYPVKSDNHGTQIASTKANVQSIRPKRLLSAPPFETLKPFYSTSTPSNNQPLTSNLRLPLSFSRVKVTNAQANQTGIVFDPRIQANKLSPSATSVAQSQLQPQIIPLNSSSVRSLISISKHERTKHWFASTSTQKSTTNTTQINTLDQFATWLQPTLQQTSQSSNKRPRIDQPIEEATNSVTNDESVLSSASLFSTLPDIPLKIILSQLDTYEQISLRRVCQRWNNFIVEILNFIRYLKLNFARNIRQNNTADRLTRIIRYHKWKTLVSAQSIQFEANWKEPKLKSIQKAQLTVRDKHFTLPRINLIGRLFAKLEVVVIYYDVQDNKENLEALLKLIRNFTKLRSFSIIRAEQCYNYELWNKHLPKPIALSLSIINTLGEMNCKLDRIDLLMKVNDKNEKGKIGVYPVEKNFIEMLAPVRHFAIASWPHDIIGAPQSPSSNTDYSNDMFLKVGSAGPLDQPNSTAKIESLCVQLTARFDSNIIHKLNLSHVLMCKPELAHVRVLQLTNITSDDKVKQFLESCPQVNTLGLYSYDQIISYGINRTKLDVFYANGPESYEDGTSAPNIQHLTFRTHYDIYSFSNHFSIEFKARYVDFIVNKFPGLNKLTLVSFYCYVLEEDALIRQQYKIIDMFRKGLPKLKEVEILHLDE